MGLEEVQHRAGEEPHRQEGQHEAQGVHADQQESRGGGGPGGGHQQDAAEGGAHAGRPGEAEGEAHHQGHRRVHGQFVQPEGEAVLLLQQHGPLAQPQLVQAEQQDDDAAGPGEPHLVVVEEGSQGGEAQPQQEEREADARHKEESVEKDPAPGIAADAVLIHHGGAAGQVADVQRHQGQHAGGEEAQRAL